jgi:hypothetical protein
MKTSFLEISFKHEHIATKWHRGPPHPLSHTRFVHPWFANVIILGYGAVKVSLKNYDLLRGAASIFLGIIQSALSFFVLYA